MSQQVVELTPVDRARFVKRGYGLESFTVVYNSLEGMIAVTAGLLAGSIALVGFGFDSVVEVMAGIVVLWRLYADKDERRREQVEVIALRFVGFSFLATAAYVGYDSVVSLSSREAPLESWTGIALAACSVIVMPILARAKRRIARGLGSFAMSAEAKQTEFCAYLSAILLGGLLLNALFGWWWADALAALVMTPIIAREGVEALRGKTCCDSGTCN